MLRSEYCNLSNVPDEEGLAKLGECPKDEVCCHAYAALLACTACLLAWLYREDSSAGMPISRGQAQCFEPLKLSCIGHKLWQVSPRLTQTAQSMSGLVPNTLRRNLWPALWLCPCPRPAASNSALWM